MVGLESPYIGNYRRAAALHDSLYLDYHKKRVSGNKGKRLKVDKVFNESMRVDKVKPFVRWSMFLAVRMFGRSVWKTKVENNIKKIDKDTFKAAQAEAKRKLFSENFYDDGLKSVIGPKIINEEEEVEILIEIAEKYKQKID